jgi:hypothetical protein
VLVADHVGSYPFGPARAAFEHGLQARAHHDHRVLEAPQARQPVSLEPFWVDRVVDRDVVAAVGELPREAQQAATLVSYCSAYSGLGAWGSSRPETMRWRTSSSST